jgi:hypothetical protein
MGAFFAKLAITLRTTKMILMVGTGLVWAESLGLVLVRTLTASHGRWFLLEGQPWMGSRSFLEN